MSSAKRDQWEPRALYPVRDETALRLSRMSPFVPNVACL
jgi:hypothetical protein